MKSLRFPVLAALALAFAVIPAAADEIGHEQARRLVEEGKIRPLDEIIERLKSEVPGKILSTELESDDGRLEYDFKILTPEGRLLEVEIDAATGTTLSVEDDD